MSIQSDQWCTELVFIIPDIAGSGLLLIATDGSWSLPSMRLDDMVIDIEHICSGLYDELGITTAVLRMVSMCIDREQRLASFVYELENRAPDWQLLPNCRWAAHQELNDLLPAKKQALLETYIAEIEQNSIPELRAPWCRKGWLDSATAWMKSQLAMLGKPCIGQIEQVKNWSLSCILR